MRNDNSDNISRKEKLSALKLNENIVIDNNVLDQLYNTFIAKESTLNKDTDKNETTIKKHDPKHIMLLKFLNAVLECLGKENINDPTEFKNVNKDDIVNQCSNLVDIYLEEIAKIFDKANISYYNRKSTKTYVITLLRKMTRLCGYEWEMKRRYKTKMIDSYNFKRDPYFIYNIN